MDYPVYTEEGVAVQVAVMAAWAGIANRKNGTMSRKNSRIRNLKHA